jgi:hypothetical protein
MQYTASPDDPTKQFLMKKYYKYYDAITYLSMALYCNN